MQKFTETCEASENKEMKVAISFGQRLDDAIERARNFLLSRQDEEGFWVEKLESNASITAELIFFMHFMDMVDPVRQKRCVNYLLKMQREDGSWPLFYGGSCDINSTVEAYMAMKVAGIYPGHPAMVKARDAIFANGGIRKTRVFTKIFLAMFGQISWNVPPAVPVEVILFPNWFPFNIYEISSWSRGTVVPLSIICSFRPVHKLGPGQGVQELFRAEDDNLSFGITKPFFSWKNAFIYLDRFIRFIGKSHWKPFRKVARRKADQWTLEHQEDEGDFGGIQPAMLNSLLALKHLGYPKDHPAIVKGLEAIDRFLIHEGDSTLLQACISPLWDTGIACNALLDSGLPADHPALVKAATWILKKQVVKPGDWKVKNPHNEPGGWAFEFYNELYPDCDDTAELLIALDRIPISDHRWKLAECQRALTWLLSMQSTNGGWAAFDKDNDKEILNEIPFADHKALLDPPTVDVTGRVLWLLGRLGFKQNHPQVKKALEFIKSEQEIDGCWFGRWGVNYIYGTFLVLNGIRAIGENMNQPLVRKAVRWLASHQNEDGGWGETCQSYAEPSLRGRGTSTASQTAWAVLGLLAANEEKSPEMEKGIHFLLKIQNRDGSWWEEEFTGTGFPQHFYIKYHMYEYFFPLMALSRYRNAVRQVS